MKTKHFFYSLVLLTVCLSACEKDKKDIDYRSQWVGEYDFVVVKDWWFLDGPYGIDTISYIGAISIESTDKLWIKYTESDSVLMDVDTAGKLSKYHEDWHRFSYGQFEGDDKVHLEHGYRYLGYGRSHIMDGIKIKR
jgi:hypothetical protein